MRKSLAELIERMHDVKIHLDVAKYELFDYDDGAFADIYVDVIKEPKPLCFIIGYLKFQITAEENLIKIRVFEYFNENE